MIRKFVYLLGARGFREVFQTAFLIYLARQSTETYGQFIFATGLGGILLVVSEFGLNQYLVPALSRSREGGDRMITRVTLVKGGFFVLGWIGIWGFLRLQHYPLQLVLVVLTIAAGAGLEAVSNTFFVTLQFHGHQKQEGMIKSAAAVAGFGYGLAAAVLGAPPVTISFFKLIDSGTGLLLALMVLARRTAFRPARPSGAWRLIQPAFVFGLLQFAAILSNRVNIIFLERFGGLENVAFYGAAWQIADGVAGIFSVLFIQSILYPAFSRMYRKDPEEAARLVRQTMPWLTLLAFPVMFFLSVEGDRLIGLIYGPTYENAVWIQRVLAPVILLSLFQNLGAGLLMGMGFEKRLLIIYLAGLGINVTLCALTIPAAPLKGAVASILAAKVVVALWVLWCCQRRLALIPGRAMIELVLAAAAGAAVYFLLGPRTVREVTEVLSVLPILVLAWTWRRRTRLLTSPETIDS